MAIKKCVCSHVFQDAKYGPGMRVANQTASGGFVCTVCGKLISSAPKPKKQEQKADADKKKKVKA